ncbi:MAG: BPTD_3080 family restriction endonuclease [Immundisolibacter sp.]|uniref:BPTD_3080 family restriction endonuclease n=1 Tax=Immundisolibacter sp. TaxID=1934948 RepID=UPI003EE000C7
MFDFQVESPIVNSPFLPPQQYWQIEEGTPPLLAEGRRKPVYFYRPPSYEVSKEGMDEDVGYQIELLLVSRIRARLAEWRAARYPGASKITLELLAYWQRDGRDKRLFFAQQEAAQTVIFLTEARADFLHGIQVPLDEPSDKQKADGYSAFARHACKMATGSGKTTVMGMLAAWSILNKVAGGHDRSRARLFSDTVLVVCPNVTIRNRLAELNPALGEASLYRSRDLVPPHLMGPLSQGRVLVTNWHTFALQDANKVGGTSARVVRTGREVNVLETIRIGEKTTTARGTRYLTLADYERQVAAGLLEAKKEETDDSGSLVKAQVASTRYVESDAAWLDRVLGIKAGRRANVLVLNDEAHHAYRIRSEEPDEFEEADDEGFEEYYKEATVWIEGLDRIHKLAGINRCLDFSATPYFLGRVGEQANRPFPWVVSSFDLMEAIESGLTKIPQFAVRDLSGQSIPGYFNIWRWILPQLKPSERGGKKSAAKPEAILRYAYTPIVMLGKLWQELAKEWKANSTDPRPPVFIVVCKNTRLAKLVYEWLAEDSPPPGIPSADLADFRNRDDVINTIRVDSNVVSETDSGEAKSDLSAWMRLTLDTVGRLDWPRDGQGSPIYPEGFVALAEKLGKPLHPPGRDVRAIVSVGMLTEGWDCNTVTHIVGLRPFMSQLLCEQVVGRGLRRASYETDGFDGDERLGEEVAQIFGVPFQIVPFKANQGGAPRPPVKTWRVRALPERADLEIRFPRVEGFSYELSSVLHVDWDKVPVIDIDPTQIPPEVEMKAGLPTNQGRPTLYGPGKLDKASLAAFRAGRRVQTLVAQAARELVRAYLDQPNEARSPVHPAALYPQFAQIISHFLSTKVHAHAPSEAADVFLAPYYGLMMERLLTNLLPAEDSREQVRLERHRGPGSTSDVDYVTRKEPFAVLKSHVNYVVPDSQWERVAAYALDNHPKVRSFVKNAGLGFAIPYLHAGQGHDYVPDFIAQLDGDDSCHVIVETKGHDERLPEKKAAAERWVRAINADGRYGKWAYLLLQNRAAIAEEIQTKLNSLPAMDV